MVDELNVGLGRAGAKRGEIMAETVTQELLRLNQKLLESIANADWAAYAELCDPTLSCFEPEAQGQIVEGMEFHRFYFQLGAATKPHCTTMASPHVRIMGDVAVVSYVRLNQRVQADGSPVVRLVEETRVWQKQNGTWKHVHFHRSTPTK
jgi:calcium/calmodulin-dependent protein kinase (CaM kinase) II